ncbi:MAG TPA: protein-methionine-sulfoxide reductase heme-binding subunit MsrQ [Clostridia bacterium]|nr:protein-methionine-sulfoxide reductase heme-binding subunit MsrQ [Clostridia bacterium]
MPSTTVRRNKLLKPIVFLLALVPLARLVIAGFTVGLGANPIEVITRRTGYWTLIFLMVTLAITPVRKMTGLHWLIQYRRMLGLFAFFYGVLHFLTYIWLDQFFDFSSIAKDVYKRPFITAGFTAFVLLIPLAITSTQGWIRRLKRRWLLLHRLIYVSAFAGVVHFIWLVKKDLREPLIFASVLAILLGWRVAAWLLGRRRMIIPAARPAITAD